MKKMYHAFSYARLIIILAVISFSFLSVKAQSIFTNPITGTNPNTANPYTTGQTVDANITVSGIGRGSGNPGTNANDRYNANGWNSGSIDLNDYFEWVLTPNASFEIDFVSLVYTGQASGTGPTMFALRSSVDGFVSNIGTATAGTTIDLSSASYQNITGAITFRLYAWGASSSTGTFSVNSFTFNGTVSLIPVACSITNVSASTPSCDGAAYFDVSFTATNGSGNYEVVDGSNNVLGSGTTSPIFASFSPATGQMISVNVRDAGNNSCAGIAVDLLLPDCSEGTPCDISINDATINGNVEASTVCSEEAFTLTADGATSTGLVDGNTIDWYYDSDFNFTPGSGGTLLGSSMVTATNVNPTRNTCTDILAGEIAFVSFQSDDPDIFSFVALANLAAGVVINFTDNGWLSSGAFRTGEGVITWTAPVGGLPIGTVVTINTNGGITASSGSVSTSGSPLLSTSGDQIISFCGTLATPTKLLAGIQFNGANWDANAADAGSSALPTGLTNGTTALAVGNVDNGRFNCAGGTVSGTATTIATSINTSSNWTTSNTILNPAVSACAYTVSGTTVIMISELETSIDDCGTFYIKGLVNPLPENCTADEASTSTLQVTLLCPTAVLSGDATICQGDSATVTINITGAPASQSVSGNITNGTIDIPFSGMTDGGGLATIQIMGITQEGSYTIETILIGTACASTTVSGMATITVNQPPVVTISNQEPVVCATRRLLLSVLQATITLNGQPFTGIWDVLEADSDGSFRDANDAVNNTFGTAFSFVPGAVDIERGYVTLILRSDDPEGPCSAVEASVRLMILRVNCGEFPWSGQ